ncbi:MAG: methytransferase partner Trm112 [archaeon]|nr:methytransferase partner Trm112 [Methanophagales archaeon]MDI6810553.1 methytransferase partner Trm112 [archaeon]MDI6885577.1 methytransferase partner Trm112 [archaeon]
MKKELMDILACPMCKGDLELSIDEEDEKGEVLTGSLYCKKCDERYPIEDGIPNLLPPELRQSAE